MKVLKQTKRITLSSENWKPIRFNPAQEEILRKLEPFPVVETLPNRKYGFPCKTGV
ncbi:MAG: hypothetical protein K5787_18680 [Lentisphaeria bacterium]|nr:hypothetical protein [Lentisphaeria bacterium]